MSACEWQAGRCVSSRASARCACQLHLSLIDRLRRVSRCLAAHVARWFQQLLLCDSAQSVCHVDNVDNAMLYTGASVHQSTLIRFVQYVIYTCFATYKYAKCCKL